MRWLLIGALIVVAALVFGRKTDTTVRVPADPNEVLEHVASSSSSGRELKALETAARESPADVARATAAAQKAIDLARRESDPRYWGRAQAALQPWWSAPRPPDEVLRLRATIRQALHDFDGARTDLEQLDDPRAQLALAEIERITGRYEQSRAACRRADAAAAIVCLAQLDSLTGHAREARAALEHEVSRLPSADAFTTLGEAAERGGDDLEAERALREALKLKPGHGPALIALADLLLATGRAAEVEPLLSSRFSDDDALLRLAIAEAKTRGRPGSYAQMLRWRYSAAAERGDAVNLREQARFALEVDHDAPRALELAAKSWLGQREPADTRVLLDAALAAGKPEAAREAARFVIASGTEEPRLIAAAKQVLRESP